MTSCLEKLINCFRKDALLSSWMLLVGTIIYLFGLEYILYTYQSGFTDYFDVSIIFVFFFGAASYLIASVLFLSVFWDYSKTRSDIINTNVNDLTLTQRCATGNQILIATWLFLLPTFLYLVLPSWALIDGYITPVQTGIILSVLLISIGLQFIWVYSAFPTSMQANNNEGSRDVTDLFLCPKSSNTSFWCCDIEVIPNARSDFVVGAWVSTILSGSVVIAMAILISYYRNREILWVFLVSFLLLFTGFFIKATTSSSQEFDTTYYFDMLACSRVTTLQDTADIPLIR